MTAIIGWCDLLLRQHRPSDASFRHIISIKQSANRAAALVKQLLAFSSRQTLQPTALRLNDVIAELAIMLDRLRGGDVALEIDHGRDLWPVMADHGQIEQVITNLVVNARDAMKGRGSLTIRTRNVPAAEVPAINAKAKLTDSVLIEVADTGPGIPEDVIDRIFDPFFSTKPFGEGTGLGLATVYGIVQQTGGSIGVESSPETGTRFRILLPRLAAGAAGEPALTATVPAGGEEAGRKGGTSPRADLTGSGAILLVEDDEAIRLLSAKALSNQGYTVYTAASGEAALALMQQRAAEIDLLITDVLMPEMDGPTLAAEVRAIRPDIRLVLMSGYAETPIDRERLGPYLFLSKPFDLKQLAAKVKEALERTPAAAA
jgi:two-component system cell cycle sensor histidine kinase/response regulator CckA